MKDILQILNEKFQGEYSYLRVGRVDFSTSDNTATITFLMPEDIYANAFHSEDVEKIETAVTEALDGVYDITFKYQKITLTEEVFKNAMIEYMERYFPLIAANIDYSRLRIFVGEELLIRMAVQENIYKYMPSVHFEERMKAFAETKYVAKVNFEFEIVPDEIRTTSFEANQANRYGKTVQVSDIKVIFGNSNEFSRPALHISTLREDGQDAICCGKVRYLKYRTRKEEENKKEGKRFYHNYYTFSISDNTGFLNVFINLNGEIPLLKDGADVICRGRVNLREDRSSFGMYARAVALCTIPYDLISEQTKPLSPPDEYSLLIPRPYNEAVYSQISVDSKPVKSVEPIYLDPTVTVSVKSVETERGSVPYEIAMCYIEGNEIISHIHTYLKVNIAEETEEAMYANSKGYAAPRFSSVIPDLIKYSNGKILVAAEPKTVLRMLNDEAIPLRYRFTNELQVFSDPMPLEDGENQRDALEESLEMARILLGKKKD